MGKWEMVRLGDVCEIINGFAFDSKRFNTDGAGMPIIRIRDVVRGYTETFTTEPFDGKYIIRASDLLIGMDGEFNIAKWKSADALLNQRVCRLNENSDFVNRSYLLYTLPDKLKEIEAATPFATVKHLSSKTIFNIEIPLPPMSVQLKIADILNCTATLVERNKEQIINLELFAKSLMQKCFSGEMF